MSTIVSPVSTITANESAQGTDSPMMKRFLPKMKNYALDENVARYIRQEIVPVIDECRNNRKELEEEWAQIRNMEFQKHDVNQRYKGNSQAYMPLWSRILATRSSALSKGIFPSDEYMDAVEYNGISSERSKKAKGYVQWELERNAKIRTALKPFLRQVESYGNSPLKYLYRKKKAYEGRSTASAIIKGLGQQDGMRLTHQFSQVNYDGAYLSTRDMFNFYIWPLTADNLEEASLVFEDITMTMMEMEKLARGDKEDRWVNIDKAQNGGSHETDYKEHEKHDVANSARPNEIDTKVGGIRKIQEVWTYMILPAEAYMDDEDRDCPIPVVIHLVNDHDILCVMRNPWYHQRPPYRFQRYNVQPGLIYGYGTGKIIRHLQYQTNDFLNQTNDCGNYLLNPIIKRNLAMMSGPMRAIRPGQTWDVTDVDNAIKFERPPFEMIQYGQQLVAMLLNYGQDFAGAPPILSGMKGGAASTATGSQLMQKNALSPIQDQVEEIEQETMLPLLIGIWRNGVQFRDTTTKVMLAGEAFDMDPAMFAHDFVFRYLASSQAGSAQQRSQMAIQFLQGVLPVIPHLMQLGYIVDPSIVIQRIYTDGLGFRGFDQFIQRGQAMGMGGALNSGNVGGMMAEQGDRLRSALEQLPGAGQVDMAAGEGEEFMDVRNEADAIAAAQGASYGGGY